MALEKPEEWQATLENVGMTEHFKTMEVPASFDDVLADANWEVIFHQYTKAEFSSENVEFLRAVGAYEASPSREMGKQIYDQYVSTDAASQVNISAAMRDELTETFGEHEPAEDKDEPAPPAEPGGDIFLSAKVEITRLTAKDTFKRFRSSALAAQSALNADEDWDAVETRGRSGGGDAPMPEGYQPAADAPPPPPDDADDAPPPPPPAGPEDEDAPPPPAGFEDDDVPPPPPSPAPDAPPPPPPPPPAGFEDDDDVPPPPASPAP
jgi:hypothetical protein